MIVVYNFKLMYVNLKRFFHTSMVGLSHIVANGHWLLLLLSLLLFIVMQMPNI